MRHFKNTVLPVMVATIWISISEFFRNEFLLKQVWLDHYAALGLSFPDTPINGMVWGIWSLAFSILLFSLSRRFSYTQSVLAGWWAGFVLMWLVAGNLGVLPLSLLLYAVPLSLLEVLIAVLLIQKLSPVAVPDN